MKIYKITFLDFSFTPNDIRNGAGFCTKLKRDAHKKTPNPGKRIWHFLSRKVRLRIANLPPDASLSVEDTSAIVDGLNELLKERSFYQEQAYVKVKLPPPVRDLLARHPKALSTRNVQKLNRLLIEAAYPREFEKKQEKKKEEKPSRTPTTPKNDPSPLQVGKLMTYNIYSNMGEPLIRQGERFTPEHQKKIRAWRDPELIGLDAEEKRAVDQYLAMGQISDDDIEKLAEALESSRFNPGEEKSKGVYLCGEAMIYFNEESLTLSKLDIDALFSLEPGKTHLASYDSDQGRNLFEPHDSYLLKAITYFFIQEGKAKKGVHPDAQPTINLDKIAQHSSLPSLPFIPRLRTPKETKEMIKFSDQAASDLANTLNTPGRRRTKLGTSIIKKHRGLVKDTIIQVLKDPDLAANFLPHLNGSDYLVDHAFKTKILSIELATNIGLSKQETMDLGLAAIVQDIGMNEIDSSRVILNKKTPLTHKEIDRISEHPEASKEIIGNSEAIPRQIRDIVLHSHERIDGSGYPNGLKGKGIDKLAKVLSVASVYAALISPRPYRQPLKPYYAMVTLMHYAYHHLLDRNIIQKLIETLSLYPIGTLVKLSSGEIAKVISANEKSYTKPRVRVMIDAEGRQLDPLPMAIDLGEKRDKIIGTVEAEKYPDLANPEVF